jgi:hypothetical protein
VWERASADARLRLRRLRRPRRGRPQAADGPTATVSLPGGDLLITWRESDSHVHDDGPGGA